MFPTNQYQSPANQYQPLYDDISQNQQIQYNNDNDNDNNKTISNNNTEDAVYVPGSASINNNNVAKIIFSHEKMEENYLLKYDREFFIELLQKYTNLYKKADDNLNYEIMAGFVEKCIVQPNVQVFVRADIHGDLRSLIENLKILRKQGFLNENFKCEPGKHIIFLGDYCDRGIYGTEVLKLLIYLAMENPDKVHLIRGNHEYVLYNKMYSNEDNNLNDLICTEIGESALTKFYETMPLALYVGVNFNGLYKYICFVHGFPELTMDMSPLLDKEERIYIFVPKHRKFSSRVGAIIEDSNHKLHEAANRINNFFYENIEQFNDPTNKAHLNQFFNWGCVINQKNNYITNKNSMREMFLGTQSILDYHRISSESEILSTFRGHEHCKIRSIDNQKVIAITLPAGINDVYKIKELAYLLRLNLSEGGLLGWRKTQVCRNSRFGESTVGEKEYELNEIDPISENLKT